MELKLVTFNLRLNVQSDGKNAWPYRKHAVTQFILEQKPFIIGTQEVLDDMLEDLKEQLPQYGHVGVTRRQGEEATPIFYDQTQLECRESGTFWLSKTPSIPNSVDFDSACVRICTWAEFMVKEDRNLRFRVYNTHLDHISKLAQIEGMKIILNHIKSKNSEEKLPFALMGDFNATSQDSVIQYLNEVTIDDQPLYHCYEGLSRDASMATFHNFTGTTDGEPIDHVYLTHHFQHLKTEIFTNTIGGIYPSDHFPVILSVRLNG